MPLKKHKASNSASKRFTAMCLNLVGGKTKLQQEIVVPPPFFQSSILYHIKATDKINFSAVGPLC